ncbi:MAG TPA: PDZ domain-containing protein [Thermoanaerobaculia bacterium]|nr:PDZ domain-containing protein [Thermoanaerobaculia bacterium]
MAKTLWKVIPLALLLILPSASRLRAGDDPPGEKRKTFVMDEDGMFAFGDDEPFVYHLGGLGRVRIGVRLIEITPELRAHYGAPREAGVLVGGVEPDSPAAKAGIQVGDVITSAEGERIASARDLSAAVRRKKGGEAVKLEVARDRAVRSLTVTVEERKGREIAMGDLQRRIQEKVRVMPDLDIRMKGLGNLDRFQERLEGLEKRLKDLEKRLPAR